MKNLFLRAINIFLNIYLLFYLGAFFTDFSFIFKKPVSNISPLTGGLLVLFISRWMIDKRTFKDLIIFKQIGWIFKQKDKHIVVVIFLLLSFILIVLGIARHLSLSSSPWDMTIYEQPLWNTLQGNILFSSLKGNNNILGDHFVPILLLVVPFYALFPHVSTAIIIQALVLAAALIPLYWIAKEKLTNRALIFSFLISFLLSKAVRGIGLSDFHPDAFIVTPSLLAFYFLIKKKNIPLLIYVLVILLCKETASLIVLGLGIYAIFSLRRFKLGTSLVLTATLSWLLETKVIIPRFNNFGVYPYMNWLPFGDTYQQNIQFVVNYPLEFLKFAFMPAKILYLMRLLGPFGFLSFFAPSQFILIFVPLSFILLASEQLSGYYLVSSHYAAHVLPFVYICAIYGARNIIVFFEKRGINIQKALAVLIIICSSLFYSKTDIYKFSKYIAGMKRNNASDKLRYLSLIPEEATVCASASLVPHLSHRKYIFTWFPDSEIMLNAEYSVIDLTMIDYLSQSQRDKLPQFLEEFSNMGFIKIFVSKDGNFLIFRNSKSGKAFIENFRGDALATVF